MRLFSGVGALLSVVVLWGSIACEVSDAGDAGSGSESNDVSYGEGDVGQGEMTYGDYNYADVSQDDMTYGDSWYGENYANDVVGDDLYGDEYSYGDGDYAYGENEGGGGDQAVGDDFFCDLTGNAYSPQCHQYPVNTDSYVLSVVEGSCAESQGLWSQGGGCPPEPVAACHDYSSGGVTFSTYYYLQGMNNESSCTGSGGTWEGDSGPPLFGGSCLKSDGTCAEYYDLYPSNVEPVCTQGYGTYSESEPCDDANDIGKCYFTNGSGHERDFFYSGDAQMLEASCSYFGTWEGGIPQ